MEIKLSCVLWSFIILETESTTHQVEQWAVFGAAVDMATKTVWCSLVTY
jgi:hypothetical protein